MLVRWCPGKRLLSAWDLFEAAERTIFGSKVEDGHNDGHGRIVEQDGEDLPDPPETRRTRLFPTSDVLIGLDDSRMPMPWVRAGAIRQVAQHAACGTICLDVATESDVLRGQLTAIEDSDLGPHRRSACAH